jgi:hypothetical protein
LFSSSSRGQSPVTRHPQVDVHTCGSGCGQDAHNPAWPCGDGYRPLRHVATAVSGDTVSVSGCLMRMSCPGRRATRPSMSVAAAADDEPCRHIATAIGLLCSSPPGSAERRRLDGWRRWSAGSPRPRPAAVDGPPVRVTLPWRRVAVRCLTATSAVRQLRPVCGGWRACGLDGLRARRRTARSAYRSGCVQCPVGCSITSWSMSSPTCG